ncbi:MAG: hypothetical protein K8H88_14140 [Sandaracinaceae bacterium]|nr:hypothetical protein [Sandaracinaceae bacterium]
MILVATLYGYRAYRASRRSRWSVVSHKDGRQVATIDHVGCDAAELEGFLQILRERVGVDRHAGAVDARTE